MSLLKSLRVPSVVRVWSGFAGIAALGAAPAPVEWRAYLGDPGRSHYSSLAQVDVHTVRKLQTAWEFHTGDFGEMQCNPLVVGGVLFGVTATGQTFALDAATGKERWRQPVSGPQSHRIVRGVTFWRDGADERILVAFDSSLCALDAHTGRPIESFGAAGQTSLRAGLGESAHDKWVVSTSPGAVCGDVIVMPTRVTEGADAAPGFIQAFNIRTGALVWTFHTIPWPGETGYDTWSSAAFSNTTVGGANCWAGMAVDEARGIVFVPTGSASPDFWGGDRIGQNRFANSLLAIEGKTGHLLWSYQFVHHDLWDRDLPAPPTLATIRHAGKKTDVVAQVTKSGHVFVFERATGIPIFPITEMAVPHSGIAHEMAWPTQPVPVRPRPFARQELTERDLSPYAENGPELLTKFKQARRGAFVPFSREQDTLLFPGFDGGAEWGGAAIDPAGILYINANEMAWLARLREAVKQTDLAQLSRGQRIYATACIACHGPNRLGIPASGFPSLVDLGQRHSREETNKLIVSGKGMMPGFPQLAERDRQALVDMLFGEEKTEGAPDPIAEAPPRSRAPVELDGYVKFVDSKGYPAIRPPWGTLTAIDLNTGERVWQIPLGEFKELTARGIPPTGTENYGGPVVTAGGLVIIAATKDSRMRIFDRRNGAQLWEADLPACGFATPCVYEAAGRQYIVIACGGTKLGTKKGDSFLAFALPAPAAP